MKNLKSRLRAFILASSFWLLTPFLSFWLLAPGALRAQTQVRSGPADNTYRAAFSVACGGSGDCATIYWASKTLRVRQVWVSKPSNSITVSLNVHSAVDSGGTPGTVPTAVPLDSNDPAATATLAVYTAAPTAGTSVGAVGLLTMATTDTWVEVFGTTNTKSLTLQKTGQGLAINVSGAATITVKIEWTE